MRPMRYLTPLVLLTLCPACGSGDDEQQQQVACSVEAQSGCEEGQVCEHVAGADPACFAGIYVEGQVFDMADESAVEGARVVAQDINGSSVSDVAVTDADGQYRLQVPATRDENGNAISTSVVLRVDAFGYVKFPTAPRVALPIDIAFNTEGSLRNAATDVALIALESTEGLGTVSGRVTVDNPAGALLVAGGATGTADRSGAYAIFNVPTGDVTVRGYLAGMNLEPTSAKVEAGKETSGIDLGLLSETAATVSGKVSLVNPGSGDATSVILVLAETFNQNLARGESPAGLRAENIAGDFAIADVPDGEYFALAAFENDFLVRDPDTAQGGTDIVGVTVAGSDVVLDESFKVTGALAVISPDAEEPVSGAPSFVWEDDSGEASYSVTLFDAFGNEVWSESDLPPVNGNKDVSVDYTGPELKSGSLYQFRATSFKNGGAPISTTEDLRGVFLAE